MRATSDQEAWAHGHDGGMTFVQAAMDQRTANSAARVLRAAVGDTGAEARIPVDGGNRRAWLLGFSAGILAAVADPKAAAYRAQPAGDPFTRERDRLADAPLINQAGAPEVASLEVANPDGLVALFDDLPVDVAVRLVAEANEAHFAGHTAETTHGRFVRRVTDPISLHTISEELWQVRHDDGTYRVTPLTGDDHEPGTMRFMNPGLYDDTYAAHLAARQGQAADVAEYGARQAADRAVLGISGYTAEEVAAAVAATPGMRRCAWCGTVAPPATMEQRTNNAGSVACKDIKACQDRITSAAAKQAAALDTIN